MGEVVFNVGGYAMTHLELWGTLLYLWSVWLVGRNNAWTWPVGNAAVVLYALLFWRIRLYADLIEQIWFFAAGCYGWWAWRRGDRAAGRPAGGGPVVWGSARERLATAAFVAAGTLLATLALLRLHLWLPQLFPEPAAFPLVDAATTVASLAATVLMAWRRIESWLLWILVDVAGIGLYAAKEVFLLAAVYAVFLALAVNGLRRWRALAAAQAQGCRSRTARMTAATEEGVTGLGR